MQKSKVATDSNIEQSIMGTVQHDMSTYQNSPIDGSIEQFRNTADLIKEFKNGDVDAIERENSTRSTFSVAGIIFGAALGVGGIFVTPVFAALMIGGGLMIIVVSVRRLGSPKKVDKYEKDVVEALRQDQDYNTKVHKLASTARMDVTQQKIESDSNLSKEVVGSVENVVKSRMQTNEFQNLANDRRKIADNADVFENIASKTHKMANHSKTIDSLTDITNRFLRKL